MLLEAMLVKDHKQHSDPSEFKRSGTVQALPSGKTYEELLSERLLSCGALASLTLTNTVREAIPFTIVNAIGAWPLLLSKLHCQPAHLATSQPAAMIVASCLAQVSTRLHNAMALHLSLEFDCDHCLKASMVQYCFTLTNSTMQTTIAECRAQPSPLPAFQGCVPLHVPCTAGHMQGHMTY